MVLELVAFLMLVSLTIVTLTGIHVLVLLGWLDWLRVVLRRWLGVQP